VGGRRGFGAIATACAAAALVVGLPARAARAGPGLLDVSYSAPDPCPSQAVLDAELARLLGPALDRGGPLSVRAVVAQAKDGRFRLELELAHDGTKSTRKLDSKSCDTLVRAAALVIALAHDPEAVEARASQPTEAAPPSPAPLIGTGTPPPSATAPSPAPTTPAPVAPAPLAPAPSWDVPPTLRRDAAPEVDRPSIFGVAIRFGPAFGVADLPEVHAGLEGTLALRVAEYAIEGAFRLGLGTTGTVEANPDQGADFRLLAGVVRGCRALYPFFDRPWPRPSLSPELAACVGVEIGVMSGAGFGVANPQEGSAVWVAPRIDGRFALGVAGPLSLAADLGVAFPVDRRRFVIEAGDTLVVHEPGPVAGRAGLAAELGF
jgi:hypothetical protein